MRTLDFLKNKVEVLTLQELEQSYHENHVDGQPVGGIYHFALIQQVIDLFERRGLHAEVQEVFAAQNREKSRPGVTVLPAVEERDGRGAVSAHLLRRVYANIAIADGETDQLVTNLAVAYHQRGIQVGIGPMVKVCHNQTILSPADVVSNYSCFGSELANTQRTVKYVLERVEQWAARYEDDCQQRNGLMRALQQTEWTLADRERTVATLMELRVRHDSPSPLIHRAATYPLNSSQINDATERLLLMEADGHGHTWWDAYQQLNFTLKPDLMDIPQVLPQQLALISTLKSLFQ